MIVDHSDHGVLKEPRDACPEWIHRFLRYTVIRMKTGKLSVSK